MEFIVLGSGGAMPTPRPFCQCKICQDARKDISKKRNASSLFLKEINGVVDCGEDIASSLNSENIKKVDYLFITHWHPDHTFGMRAIVEANWDFREAIAKHRIELVIPKKVFKQLKEHFDCFDYWENIQKTIKIVEIEDGWSKEINGMKVTAVGYTGKDSETFAYLFEEKGKMVLYSPCDTISFSREDDFHDLDLLITETGLFSEKMANSEIFFPRLIERIKRMNPKKVLMTHIEEVELQIWGEEYLQKMKDKYSNINLDFVSDGMKINV